MKKTAIRILFLTVLFIGLPVQQNVAGRNVILNPGFEASSSVAANWLVKGPVAGMEPLSSIDDKIRYEGHYALKMQSMNPNCHGRATQTVETVPGETYMFSASFRAENVGSLDKSVLIKIKWFKGGEQVGYDYLSNATEGNDGWLQASDKIKSPANATSAEISLEFRWSTGTVWWDDISLEKCPEVSPRKIKVGTIYFRPMGPTVEENVRMMGRLLDQAGESGCSIICLPEGWPTCNTGLGMTKVEANTIGGSASKMMASKAKQYRMYIVSGLYNWTGDTLYNIAALYNRAGDIQGIYRKVQLPDSEAEAGAVPGDSFPVFDTDFGRIGIQICWDSFYPEISRILALNGAEIIFCPIWGDVRFDESWKFTARSRAVDNGVYFVTSIFDGHSLIVNPSGDVLQESGTQGTLLTADIDLNYNPPWNWIGNAGRGIWKTIWRKDRRSDVFGTLSDYKISPAFSSVRNNRDTGKNVK